MRITELSDDHNHTHNHNHNHTDNDNDALPSFLGLKVTPQEPQTVTFRTRIRFVQATLGELSNKDSKSDRSLLLFKLGNDPEIIASSLRLKYKEMSSLRLDHNGPNHIRFSVEGPFDIHLIGYLYDEPAIPATQIFSSKDQPSCSNEREALRNNTDFVVPKSNPSSHLPTLNIPTAVHLHGIAPDIANEMNKDNKEGSFDIMLKRVTKAQIEALSKVMDFKLQGANSVRRKLDYLLENEVKEKAEEDASHGTAAQVIVHSEESEVNKNQAERHGSPEYHVLQSKKSKKLNKRKKNNDDQDDQIRSTTHYSLQTPEVDVAEGKRLKKKLKKQKQAEVDHNRSTTHDSLQTPEVDVAEGKRLKKKLKKQKQAEVDLNRAVHDGLQTAAFDFGEVQKLHEHIVEDDSISSGHGLPEDHAADIRKAKSPKKSKKMEVVQEEVRSQEARLVVLALPCHSKR